MEVNFIVVIVSIIVIILLIAIFIIWWLTYRILFQPTRDHIWYPSYEFSNVFIPTSSSTSTDAIIINSNESITNKLPSAASGQPLTSLRSDKFNPEDQIFPYALLHCWWFRNFPGKKVVLFFHGNNANISHREYAIEICRQLELNLFLPDYRGFGLSSGASTLDNIKTDAEKIYAFVRKHYDPNDIIIWGESLGGTPALKVASSYSCHKLVLFATFASIEDVIWSNHPTGLMKILGYMTKYTMTPMPNKEYMKSVTCPVIILHSKEDDRIPYINAEILCNNVKHGNVELVTFKGSHGCPTFKCDSLPKLSKFLGFDEKQCAKVQWDKIFEKLGSKIEAPTKLIAG